MNGILYLLLLLVIDGATVTRDERGAGRWRRRWWPLDDVEGEVGTNVGAMLAGLRATMSEITGEPTAAVRV